MSGSSGGGGGGGGTDDEVIACDVLRFETQIASPNSEVVPTLKIGDELQVIIASASKTQEIQVVTTGGQLVGGLLAVKVQRMRECMLESHTYKATVKSVNGGQVRVLVEHA
ncbi:hypothetical protein AVHY2522_20590 [Acidovorax sp. SUPP2522]|uniref:hypothetical protein n=1 Tax=unclassified Acidovorax TaxID=2684926 RepID=UPI002349FC0F|nr:MULTISPECIES: hypothetical protein [unclassified Acidovorax]WCM97585.1 hypothetical protein M5C96_24920 [Acidovorax sp. GBBC 1281]GKT18916.1 hypothetical protein AVHY2522_20590 [Acidovorax sp. SUPP2522]